MCGVAGSSLFVGFLQVITEIQCATVLAGQYVLGVCSSYMHVAS